MKNKLLNFSKNLIISIGLVVIVMMLFFTTSSYAADNLGTLMRSTVSDWYRFILKLCITVYIVSYLVIIIKLLSDKTPERLKIVKESLLRFFVMFAVIYFLHYIMIAIMQINTEGIKIAKDFGATVSEIDMATDEYDLYETALSKAYELSAVPGFIGLLMYLLLVYYTYKFVFVYAKRYINVIVLILLAPIIFVMSTIKRILTGVSDRNIGKWFKEFIFNIIIQTLHALFYAILIGLTLKMSDNDENLVGALLTLILFGFIFKIDAVVRKVFNFVGGSTTISSSKSLNRAINTAGSVAGAGIDLVGGGINNLAGNIDKNGFKGGIKQSFADGKTFVGNKFDETKTKLADSITNMPNSIKQKSISYAVDLKNKSLDTFGKIKEEAKDADKILNGERVKEKLTTDEIVRQQHIIDEGKGMEGLRQKVQNAGLTVVAGGRKIANVGKYTGKQVKRAVKNADARVKKGIEAAKEELQEDIENLENNFEMVKRIPKVVKSLKKNQRYVQNAEGLNVDVSNAMMLVVDSDLSPETLVANLKDQFGDDIDVSAFIFENVGAQAFLSPAVGSPRMGMSVLAEAKYEEKAERKVFDAVTGNKRQKRTLKKASRRESKRAVKQVAKTMEKSVLTNKVYKFSRFTPNTARKITNKMLKKNREQNRYLFVISKTYEDLQINDLSVRGRVKKNVTEFNDSARMVRSSKINSIRKIKLSQRAALTQYKELYRQTRKVEQANSVAGAVMTAKNTIRLGFEYIDNMSPEAVTLRTMIQEGTARTLESGLIAVKQSTVAEEKVKATGIVNNEENTVIQFVIDKKTGELKRQVVTADGKIVDPAPEYSAEKTSIFGSIGNGLRNSIARGGKSGERAKSTTEQNLEKTILKGNVVTNVDKLSANASNPEAFDIKSNVMGGASRSQEAKANETKEQVQTVRTPVTETIKAALREQSVTESNVVENEEIFRQDIYTRESKTTSTPVEEIKQLDEVVDKVSPKRTSIIESIRNGLATSIAKGGVTEERERPNIDLGTKILKGNVVTNVDKLSANASNPEAFDIKSNVMGGKTQTAETTSSDDFVVQHIVTLEGKIVEQVVNVTDDTVVTEKYQIVDNLTDKEKVLEQIQSVVTNEDLGIEEVASVEEKFDKFQDLLQDLHSAPLLEQVLNESTEVEETIDEAILVGMQEAEISTVKELKTLTFGEELDENLNKKKDRFSQAITEHMVSIGVVTQDEVDENDDIVGNALDVLNSRVQKLDGSELIEKAAEMERIKVAEELVNTDRFNVINPPTDEDIDNAIDKKAVNLSDLIVNLSKEAMSIPMVEESVKFPKAVIAETIDASIDVLENAIEGTKSKEELQFEKEVEKAEKKWAKEHKEEANENVVERVVKQEKGEDDDPNAVVKITLKFFGAVESQGKAVTLSNRYSIKEFYDKAKVSENANLEKTQARFMQVYGDKIKALQLDSFSFAKNPVEAMDGWSIYVVTDEEDVNNDTEKEREEIYEDIEVNTPIDDSLQRLLDEYYSGIARIFKEFAESNEIETFNQIHRNPDNELELARKLRMFFFRHGESSSGEKAKEVVKNIHKDIRFKNLLRDINSERLAKNMVKASKSKVKVTNKKEAEKTVKVNPEKVQKIKEEEKTNLMNQILEETITEQEQAVGNTASQEISNLLQQMREEVFVGNQQNINQRPKRVIMQ